ncbi:hypothetical protein MUP65_00380, partial [Patescibacteria group bacterium]|nr:hypothetical protein [Patescibacteria group bacterium]
NLDISTKFRKRKIIIKTNSYGMHWREVSLTKSLEKKRIAFVGDSFTFGLWADRVENSFVGVFDSLLSSESFEVLNFGVNGYGLDDEELLIKEEFTKVLVFGRTKWGVNKLEKSLTLRGFKAAAIHGNKSQNQRTRALAMLKNSEVQVLLATDVASRGLDIDDVTHVINYDVPGTYDDYVHRIGRTGRAGKKGVALTFVD